MSLYKVQMIIIIPIIDNNTNNIIYKSDISVLYISPLTTTNDRNGLISS